MLVGDGKKGVASIAIMQFLLFSFATQDISSNSSILPNALISDVSAQPFVSNTNDTSNSSTAASDSTITAIPCDPNTGAGCPPGGGTVGSPPPTPRIPIYEVSTRGQYNNRGELQHPYDLRDY